MQFWCSVHCRQAVGVCTCCRCLLAHHACPACLAFCLVQGVAGISCLWRVAEYWRLLYGLPEQLPAEMAERLRPARQKALHKVPSALQQAGAGSDEEPGGGRGGGDGEDDEEAEYDPGGWAGGWVAGQPA